MRDAGLATVDVGALEPERVAVTVGAAALERATVAASAVAAEETVDGWLVRTAPGKAKRARSVQALAAGAAPLEERLADIVARYRRAGLPPLVRITPFSEPAGLDGALAARGWHRFDETRVMARALAPGDAAASFVPAAGTRVVDVDGAAYAVWVGGRRGSSEAEIAGHVTRLAHSPVNYRAVHLVDAEGQLLAGGQLALDGTHAGLYDVFVDPAHRRAGRARALCAALVARAAAAGAAVAYLQVDLANGAATALYAGLGFAEAYRYHYRQAPDALGASSPP